MIPSSRVPAAGFAAAQPIDSRWLTGREAIKFGALVGLFGIFFDAALAHGLFWENDPYWTYWITKTFLITTVFALTTVFFGVGIAQGALATVAHTLILEIYYQWLSPIGLPREPQWLSFDHLWITGLPIHYGVIFAGYLATLWLWRRRPALVAEWPASPQRLGAFALTATGLALVIDGLLTQGLILREFPGVTFFVVRALIAVPFFLALGAYLGLDLVGIAAGSVLLALAWTTYSMYLGPTGLPLGPIQFAGYEALWLRSFPGHVIALLIGTWLAARVTGLDHPRVATGTVPVGPGVTPRRAA